VKFSFADPGRNFVFLHDTASFQVLLRPISVSSLFSKACSLALKYIGHRERWI